MDINQNQAEKARLLGQFGSSSQSEEAQLEALKKKALGTILERDAYERLGRVRFANPQLAQQAEMYLLQIYQQGKIQKPVTDQQLKEVLVLLSEKRETSIKRR